jgi:hypothetical protein
LSQSTVKFLAFSFRMRFRAALIVEQRLLQLGQNIIGNVDILENLTQPFPQLLFSKVWKGTFSSIPSTMVIDILLFFYFCGDRAVVVSTAQQSAECELVIPIFGLIVPSEHTLHTVKENLSD